MIGRRFIVGLLTGALALSGLPGCSPAPQNNTSQEEQGSSDNGSEADSSSTSTASVPEFSGLSDPDLRRYIEDTTYAQLVDRLDNAGYFVENVQATYVSQEYLDELAYNSKENIYFGYTLDELEAQFQGARYVYTLGEDGHTDVKAVGDYDDTYDQVVRNVAVGTGVILVCVTVSAVTAGAGAPAASMIFAVAAENGAMLGLSGGAISAGTAALVTGFKTGDPEQTLKAAALSGSEGFMIGAIGGAVAGGVGEAAALHGASLNGLTMNEAAQIQKESKYPLDLIKQFHSMDEYQVYQQAGLKTQMVNGKTALVRDIDLDYKSPLPDGKTEVTNLERMRQGYAPIDSATGKYYQLHHIGQKSDGTLAILTEEEHQGNSAILNTLGKESEIDRGAFNTVRKEFWQSYASYFS